MQDIFNQKATWQKVLTVSFLTIINSLHRQLQTSGFDGWQKINLSLRMRWTEHREGVRENELFPFCDLIFIFRTKRWAFSALCLWHWKWEWCRMWLHYGYNRYPSQRGIITDLLARWSTTIYWCQKLIYKISEFLEAVFPGDQDVFCPRHILSLFPIKTTATAACVAWPACLLFCLVYSWQQKCRTRYHRLAAALLQPETSHSIFGMDFSNSFENKNLRVTREDGLQKF